MAELSFYGRAMAAAPYYNTTANVLWLNKSGCGTTTAATLVANFTVSGDLRTTEKLMVTTTVLMTLLGSALFALCVLARLSGSHRGHSAATRIFFRASFALFLPFMSYMFSQAKAKNNAARANLILLWMILVELLRKKVYAMVAPKGAADFSNGVGRYSFFDAVEEAARMVWVGYLIYSYVHDATTKTFFVFLWVFSVAKLCKRASCIELAKRSYDLAKNASLVSGYMAQLAKKHQQLLLDPVADDDHGGRRVNNYNTNILRRCNYVVMGESRMTKKETPFGFRLPQVDEIIEGHRQRQLQLQRQDLYGARDEEVYAEAEVGNVEAENTLLVRVCTVWHLAETDPVFRHSEHRRHKLQDTCLGLALFKLLRRKIERQPMAEAGTAQALAFVRWGLLQELGAARALEVVQQELTFLDEYYQAIIPLALPNPELFFANFAFSILLLLVYVIAVMLVTGNGHMFRVLASLFRSLVDLSTDMVLQYRCFVHQASLFLGMVISSQDLVVTFLLTATFLVIETFEFVQYLISDWHLASVLCNYALKPALRRRARVQRTVRVGLWIRAGSHRIKVHQFTLLKLHHLLHPRQIWLLLSRLLKRRLVGIPDAVVSVEAKEAVVNALKGVLDRVLSAREGMDQDHPAEAVGGDACLSGVRAGSSRSPHRGTSVDEWSCFTNGKLALRRCGFGHLAWACDENGGVAAVILVWHLATALLETRADQHPLSPAGKAAVMLSRYCAYLVAYEPGLLPDDRAWTERAYADIAAELDGFFQSCCATAGRRSRLMDAGFHRGGGAGDLQESTAMEKGVMLAKELESAAGSGPAAPTMHREKVWTMLLELWAELLVLAACAPAGRAEAHALALANGGEFVTHIWTILVHAGVRPRRPNEDTEPVELSII
jgi:hypothetical protein